MSSNSKSQTPKSKKEPITKFPNSKFDQLNGFNLWSLVLGILDINWHWVFVSWNFINLWIII